MSISAFQWGFQAGSPRTWHVYVLEFMEGSQSAISRRYGQVLQYYRDFLFNMLIRILHRSYHSCPKRKQSRLYSSILPPEISILKEVASLRTSDEHTVEHPAWSRSDCVLKTLGLSMCDHTIMKGLFQVIF